MALSGVARYGYVYARVRARFADVLDAGDIRALIEAEGWDEFISTLMNTPYGKVATGAGDARELERALKQELTAQYMMIMRSVTEKRLRNFFHHFFRRLEVENLKAIIRLKARRHAGEPLMYPVDDYFKRGITMLAREDITIDALFDRLKEPYKSVLSAHMAHMRKNGDTLPLERALDKEIFTAIFESARRLHGDDRRIVREIVGLEVDIANVIAFLRCKQEDTTADLLPFAFSLPFEKLRDAAFAEDIPSSIRSLPDGIIRRSLERAIPDYESEHSLLPFEKELRKMFYERVKSIIRGYPINIGTIIGFLYVKEIEIQNICAIAIGKEHEMPADNLMKLVLM